MVGVSKLLYWQLPRIVGNEEQLHTIIGLTFNGKSEPDVEQMCWFVSLFSFPNGNIYS